MRIRSLTTSLGVSCAVGLTALLAIAGCDWSDSTPAQKFEKPAGYKDSGTTHTADEVFKRQRQDRGDDGFVKPGKARSRR